MNLSFFDERGPMAYRADIDGLRALAVLAVISFHLNFGVSGGFLGVDVFFVISGYLITRIIVAGIETEEFSILEFYARRARRILPALISTILASSIAAGAILDPPELIAFEKSVIAAVLFCGNIHFFAVSGYFAPASETIPLLHLWSLGIEEQFYILFPALALIGERFSRNLFMIVLGALCAISLAASQLMLATDPPAAFYLLPFRGFALLLGCLIALAAARPLCKSDLGAHAAALAGAALVIVPIITFGPSTPYPGLAAAVPSLGAALIILSGEARSTFICKLLSQRILVGIGKISYSLYLVHWPVIVFGTRLFPSASPTGFGLSSFAISFLLALFNYRFIERPFRQGARLRSSARTLAISAAAIACFCGVSAWTIHTGGFAAETDEKIKRVLAFENYDHDRLYRDRECYLSADQDFSLASMAGCLPRGTGPSALLWGDSHAVHLYPGLNPAFEKEGFSLGVLTASACAPIVAYQTPARPKCTAFNEHALKAILSLRPSIVILSARWPTDEASLSLLDRTVAMLARAGIKVVVLGESPLYKHDVPLIMAKRLQEGDTSRLAKGGADLELDFLRWSDRTLSARFANREEVRYVSVMHALCPNDDCPLTDDGGSPVHFDTAHLTKEGSILFAKVLAPLILH
ncbi:MAG: acyltransferase [Hyphomicrobiales bacterium]|nr:acyltransferase [Hyphomicrobiales bacterium]